MVNHAINNTKTLLIKIFSKENISLENPKKKKKKKRKAVKLFHPKKIRIKHVWGKPN